MNFQDSSDAERKAFFERARRQAEQDYNKNKRDAGALTRWGGAMLELANFLPGEEASTMVNGAVQKFEAALEISPKKHDTLWCLGNAYTSQGFLEPEKSKAMTLFSRAKECFTSALELEPSNNIYQKGVEMTQRAPDLYEEIQKQLRGPTAKPAQSDSKFWFDVLGYVTVIVGVLGVNLCIQLMASNQPSSAAPGKKA